MFDEYRQQVLASYREKKTANQLSNNLENPRRSKLRAESLKVYRERYTAKDDEMLKDFFDPLRTYNDHVRSIEKFELDKFRPLITFLAGETTIRDELSVKFLAWLINFDTYSEWRAKDKDAQDNPPKLPLAPAPPDKTPPRSGTRRWFNIIFISVIILLVSAAAFFSWQNVTNSRIRQPLATEKCMYWNGDHYEPVKCDQKLGNAPVVPINIHLLNSLRRINLPDTLTKYALGKVWYSTTSGKPTFFTDSGVNPIDTNRRLLRISAHMLSRHVSYGRYILNMTRTWIIGTGILILSVAMFLLGKKGRGTKLNR